MKQFPSSRVFLFFLVGRGEVSNGLFCERKIMWNLKKNIKSQFRKLEISKQKPKKLKTQNWKSQTHKSQKKNRKTSNIRNLEIEITFLGKQNFKTQKHKTKNSNRKTKYLKTQNTLRPTKKSQNWNLKIAKLKNSNRKTEKLKSQNWKSQNWKSQNKRRPTKKSQIAKLKNTSTVSCVPKKKLLVVAGQTVKVQSASMNKWIIWETCVLLGENKLSGIRLVNASLIDLRLGGVFAKWHAFPSYIVQGGNVMLYPLYALHPLVDTFSSYNNSITFFFRWSKYSDKHSIN